MNHRERILAAIQHKKTDRIPTDLWATQEVIQKLYRHFNVDNTLDLYKQLNIDGIFHLGPDYIGPQLPEEIDGYRVDEWGRGWRKQSYNTGVYEEQVTYPLAYAQTIEDLEAYQFPSPDWYDYSSIPAKAKHYEGRTIEVGYTAIFYYHTMLRGLENAMMDLALRPDFTHMLIKKLSDFFDAYHQRCFESGKGIIDITQVTDDFGSQNGLLISPRDFEKYFRVPMQKAIDLAKSYGIFVFHHDDGDCRRLMPAFLEMGIDILNPIQWRCGDWNLSELKDVYGKNWCFHGGVDNQGTLPFGTESEVRSEVQKIIKQLASDDTGFILAPCHNIQANTPVDNIIAMYDEANHYTI